MHDRRIALVDENDNIIGFEYKDAVHKKGLLHRAFSLFVFNDKNELLLQKRAKSKYHSPGLWTNTCCSHLIENCEFEDYIHERLEFEMGFDCIIQYKFSFHYKICFNNGLTENEIDHVYFGKWNGTPSPNPIEAEDYKWYALEDIIVELEKDPDEFTYWFKEAVEQIMSKNIKILP
ncbi:MAG: isopentenyl-diphosphate Delta-isomerase [Bacteroidales bacterium]|jgi:isopentenyl-diphosphate delta-isomerase|nr:isopentenyl-diphosphate Delta-isomerase [Bacteroidales bacterium]MDD3860922.1 isopentenyl-diphosphate Delta-isomerase [Bacteroidales bacterium]